MQYLVEMQSFSWSLDEVALRCLVAPGFQLLIIAPAIPSIGFCCPSICLLPFIMPG
jgi:hypothetical protein